MIVEFTWYADLELVECWQSENSHSHQTMQCNIVDALLILVIR